METNIEQNTEPKQPEGKSVGIIGGLALFTGFVLVLILIFYGINLLIG